MKYPDLDYFETLLLGNIRKKYPDKSRPEVECVYIFPQTWPNTACGFSEPNMFSGQAFTTELTTVMKVCLDDSIIYGVFFDKKPAYMVEDANELFLKDLENHAVKSKYEAGKVY